MLSDFRDRLAEDGRAGRLLDLLLVRLKESGLVKARGRQRTDSTRVLSAGRELTRLELVTEAVRAVLEHLATAAPQILDELVTADWSERYGRQVRMCSQPSRPVAWLTQVGADAYVPLERVYGRFGEQMPPQANVPRRLLIQNFWTDARGKFRPRTERDGLPPSRIRIQSPYETEARWVRRGDTRWTGYLLHVTETCDEDRVNVVTDVATWVSEADSQALPGIHGRLKKRRLLPGRAPGGRGLRLRRRTGGRRPELQDRAGGADRQEQLQTAQGRGRVRQGELHHRLRPARGHLPQRQGHRQLERDPVDAPTP